MGDPAGIGPEIAAAAARSPRVRRVCEPVLIGDPKLLPRLPAGTEVVAVEAAGRVAPGRPSAASGRASFEAFRLAVELARAGHVDGVVTAPVSKEAWTAARVGYLDHTDYLARRGGGGATTMALLAGGLRAVLVTRHIPLADVPRRLDRAAFDLAARLTVEEFRPALGRRALRLGVCALNPHAGEGGLLGSEEKRRLAPWTRAWRGRPGVASIDLFPADDAWKRMARGKVDVLLALYHDQAMIPLKALAPEKIVNWTLGLGFTRTSPGHGTAWDIAGRGQADPSAMIEAALAAARRASGRAGA